MSRVGSDTTLLRATVTSGVVEVAGSVVIGGRCADRDGAGRRLAAAAHGAVGRSIGVTVRRPGLAGRAAAVAAGAGGGRRDVGRRRAGAVGGAHHPGQRCDRARGRRRRRERPAFLRGRRAGRPARGDGVAGRLDRRPGRVPRRPRASAGTGWPAARSAWRTSSRSSSTCSCWSCRWAGRSAPGPSCRPGSARWPGSRRSSRWTRSATSAPERARRAAVPVPAPRRRPDAAARARRRLLRLRRRHARCCAGSPSRCRRAAGWRWSARRGRGSRRSWRWSRASTR